MGWAHKRKTQGGLLVYPHILLGVAKRHKILSLSNERLFNLAM